MPTAGRDRRREQQAENAQRWRTWLTTAMTQTRATQKDIVEGSDGTIDKGSVSNWVNGKNPASAESALTVARILDRDPMDALHAAGHDALAEALAEAVEREYRARLARSDTELAARLAAHEDGAKEAVNGAAHGNGTTG